MLTTKEAAQRLGFKNTSSVRQLLLAGRLKGERRGRDWFVDEEDIERYQKERRLPGRPKADEGTKQ